MNGTEDDFKKRIKSGKWPIFSKTHHRNKLRIGHDIIFYLAGKSNKKILGTAKIASKLQIDKDSDFTVSLSEVDVWKKPLFFKELVSSLGFIKNKDNWGISLQGGAIPLPEEDYNKIINS